MELDIIALSAVAGGVASVGQWILHRILANVGVDLTASMKQFVITPALALTASLIYISVYSGIELGSETDWGAVFITALGASQFAYTYILPKLTAK